MASKTVFISADHGLAVFYFLQSQIIPTLREAGVKVVVLTEDQSVDLLSERFAAPGRFFSPP